MPLASPRLQRRSDRPGGEHQHRPHLLPSLFLTPHGVLLVRLIDRVGQIESGGAFSIEAEVVEPLGAVCVGVPERRLERHALGAQGVQTVVVAVVQHLHPPPGLVLCAGEQARTAELETHAWRD